MKKILSLLLAVLTLAGSFAALPANTAYASAGESVGGIIKTNLTVQSETSRQVTVVLQGGDNPLGPHFQGDQAGTGNYRLTYPINVVKDGGSGTTAYCITPFARGASPNNEPQTLDSIPFAELDDLDKQLIGIMIAGYPTTSHGRSANDEYMATQIAIQHFVFQHSDKYPNPRGVVFKDDSWSHWEQLSILELAKIIYNQGISNPYSPESATVGVEIEASNEGRFKEDGDNLEMALTISIDGTFTKGKLTFDSVIRNMIKSNPKCKITVGSKTANFEIGILGKDDHEEGIKVLPGETSVKITLDKKAAEGYMDFSYSGDATNGSYTASKEVNFTFAVVGGTAKQAYMGKNRNAKNQNYIFIAEGETQPIQQKLFMATADEWLFEEEPGSGGLKILKYNQKTNTLVSGAIFEIRGVSASNWDFLVHIQASPGAALPLPDGGTAITGVGTIELRDIRPGQYQITEITPPPYFDYCDFGVNSQVVTVVDTGNSGLYPQVRFENNPFATLKIRKIDAVTGSPVNGAILRIRNTLADFDIEMTTMNGGVIELKNLPQGNYEISEVYAPEGYVLSGEKKTATLRWGETTDITFENTPKTELLVHKIDGETGADLEGAVFRLTKPDTGDVWEDVTFFDGCAVFLDIPAGTYVLEEIKAPEGYILDSTKRTIVVQNYKTNEVYVQNFKKPTLVILKVDEDTAQPLPGAEFRVAKMNDQIIYEGITGADGTIKLEGLSSEWYKITEIAAPHGYLIATETKDVFFEAGQVLEVKFDNRRRPALEIVKIDERTNKPLAGAVFHVRKTEDSTISEYITGADGKISITDMDEAIYSIFEVAAPDGYILEAQHKDIELEWGKVKQLVFTNTRKPTLIVTKLNGLTNQPVPGATYKIEYEAAGGGLVPLGSYLTDANGQIVIPNVNAGWYVVTETKAAPGFSLPANPVTRIYLSPGENAYLAEGIGTGTEQGGYDGDFTVLSGNDFTPTLNTSGELVYNWPLNSIVIKKTHAITGELLAGAAFELYRADGQVSGVPGTNVGRFTTDNSGVIVITGLEPGYYVVKEVQAPQNFLISENSVQNGFLKADGTTVLEFTFANYPYGSLLISKIDALTGEPLAGARFKVVDGSGAVIGNSNGEYVTDSRGEILIPNIKPTAVVVTEIQAPTNYAIITTPQTVQIGTDGKTYKVVFDNYPYGALIIRKMDSATHEPLAGVEFKVTTSDGSIVGNSNGVFVTDALGIITIPNLPKDSYIITETKTLPTHILENQTRTIAVDYGQSYTLDFYNKHKSGLQIIKIDAANKAPLAHAWFTVYKMNGELIGEYETNGDGIIILDNLSPGWVKIVESRSPDGFLRDDTPRDVEITANQFVKVVFENKRIGSLQIKKINEADGSPLAGATFTVAKQNGEYVGEYTTGADGIISIAIEPSWLVISEKKAPDGYILDSAPKIVEVKAAIPTIVTFTNKPLSGLLIVKTDAATGKPLTGVVFDVTRADGQRVTGDILDGNQPNTEANSPNKTTSPNGDISGSYTTDANGRIQINSLPAGEYHVVERQQLPGYELDTAVHSVTVTPGKLATLQLTNQQKAGLRLVKIDSITKKPIYNVEFMLFDQNNKVVGTYYTNNNGVIDFSGILSEGRYTIRETRAAAGYYLDEIPKMVEFVSGKVTEIVWTNVPKMAQIQIMKLSGDDNEVNGLPAGTPLAGAIFEAYDYKTGNLVDRFVSGSDGRAVSAPLPLGRYLIKEVQAPRWYKLSDKTLDVELEFATQIIKLEYLNYAANTGVTIRKTGPVECMPGDAISYTIKEVRNTGTTPLTDFYWRDTLPMDAVRLTKIVTGSYNQALKYKVMITTNKGDTRVIADNLSTTKNNVIDCSNASLGLKNDEFVTSFTLVFGTVKAGFSCVEQPQIFVKTLSTLQNGYQFANKADVGGKYGNEWIVGNSTTLCTVYKKSIPLPRTGY